MHRTSHTAILMATYNGERFLAEQIRSLLSQTYQDWHLYVHDDGSQDDTVSIVRNFAATHPDKITILDYPPTGGPCKNFLSMVERVDAPYYMFCDQDDVWMPEKIQLSVTALKEAERAHPGKGIVVHTDLQIVDEKLSPVADSMWEHAGIFPQYIKTFADSGGHTAIATGCTMIFNDEAKKCCNVHAAKAIMHDCWVCLCVLSQGGLVEGIAEKTVLYRQHAHNTLGATGTAASQIGIRYRLRHWGKIYDSNAKYYSMLSSLGYGSWLKYLLAKVRYKQRIRRGKY